MVESPAPILCRVWGHKLNQEMSYHYYIDYCERCGRHVSNTGLREQLRRRLWLLRGALVTFIRPVARFFRRCPDCRRRFNQCDGSVEHFPL